MFEEELSGGGGGKMSRDKNAREGEYTEGYDQWYS